MYYEIQKYEKLKEKVNNIVEYLNKCIEQIEVPASNLDNYYSIDSVGIDENSLKSVKDDFIYRKNYLVNNVLPAIREEIRKLNETGAE